MDTFDLKWPKTQATFYTDGWRCRIVWRQQGGPGGTIDNHGLCKRRLADSLEGAPYLLSALRARGYGNLAQEIEGLVEIQRPVSAGGNHAAEKPMPQRAAPLKAAAANQVSAVKTAADLPLTRKRVASWIADLEGDATFTETGPRRAKSWFELGHLGAEQLQLKAPAPSGKQEWVLKRAWPESDRKTEYVAAPSLRGLLNYLYGRMPKPVEPEVDTLLHFCGAVDHPETAHAIRLWKDSGHSVTH